MNMSSPLFSILIANYNNGKFLMDAIDSIRRQTYANWEIIIVDDYSSDNSSEIYTSLQNDGRIKIFYNDKNRGCGYTKHRCAEEASGEWCAFLDPDDAIREDALLIMKEYIEQYPKCGVFFSHMYICDENLVPHMSGTFSKDSDAWKQFIHFQRGIPLYCFNKGVYLSTRGIHLSLPQSVDIDLYYLMSEVTEPHYIDLPLYYYRNNPVSLTKNPARATTTHLWVMLDSLARQHASEQQIWREMELFWLWRTDSVYQELTTIKQDKFYRLGQCLRRINRVIKRLLICK